MKEGKKETADILISIVSFRFHLAYFLLLDDALIQLINLKDYFIDYTVFLRLTCA